MRYLIPPQTVDCCIVYGSPSAHLITCPAVFGSHSALIRGTKKTKFKDRSSNDSHFGARGALLRPANQQRLSGRYTPTTTPPTWRSWSLAETSKSAKTFGPVHSNHYTPYDSVTKSCGYMLYLGWSIFGVHLFVRILELNLTLFESSLEPNTLAYTTSTRTCRENITGFGSDLLDTPDTSRTLSPI